MEVKEEMEYFVETGKCVCVKGVLNKPHPYDNTNNVAGQQRTRG